MFDVSVIETVGTVIVMAAAAVLLSRPLQVPSIVAYLFAGLLLGPVLQVLPEPHDAASAASSDVEVIAHLGIVLLLFLVGLELSVPKVRDVGSVAVTAGLGQVVFTAAGGFVIAWLLGFNVVESVFLATALTFSSTVVVVKVLDQKGELDHLYGRIAVGIFLVQDLVVIVVLTVLAGLGTAEAMDIAAVGRGLGRAFAGMGLMLALALVAARYLLPRPFEWAARSPRTLVIWSLGWCFLFVVLADAMGLSREIGAFLAGLSLAQLRCSQDLRRRVHPLMNFFIAVFFVTLGAQMQFDAAMAHWQAGIALSLFVLIGNPLIFLAIIARFGYSERTAFFTSVTVAQISEFSFIFAAVGLNAGLIDESILSLIAVVGLVTIVVSVYMILYSEQLYRTFHWLGLLKIFHARGASDAESPPVERNAALSGHVIVVGMNALGRHLVELLHSRGETVLAVDSDVRKLSGLPCATLVGNVDYRAVLRDAALSQAKLAVTALKIEDTNNLFVYRCKMAGVPVAAHAFDRSVLPGLERLEPRLMIDSKAAADRHLDVLLQRLGVLPE